MLQHQQLNTGSSDDFLVVFGSYADKGLDEAKPIQYSPIPVRSSDGTISISSVSPIAMDEQQHIDALDNEVRTGRIGAYQIEDKGNYWNSTFKDVPCFLLRPTTDPKRPALIESRRTYTFPLNKKTGVLFFPKTVGWCGSDVSYLNGSRDLPKEGVILGHEFSGEIIWSGPEAKEHGFDIGDIVGVAPYGGSARCVKTKNPNWSLSDPQEYWGVPSLAGGVHMDGALRKGPMATDYLFLEKTGIVEKGIGGDQSDRAALMAMLEPLANGVAVCAELMSREDLPTLKLSELVDTGSLTKETILGLKPGTTITYQPDSEIRLSTFLSRLGNSKDHADFITAVQRRHISFEPAKKGERCVENVIVVGNGTTGCLSVAAIFSKFPRANVVVVGRADEKFKVLDEYKHAFFDRMEFVNITNGEWRDKITTFFEGKKADVLIDACPVSEKIPSSRNPVISAINDCTENDATVMGVARPKGLHVLPYMKAIESGRKLRPTYRFDRGAFQEAASILRVSHLARRLLDSMITVTFPFEKTPSALELLTASKDELSKFGLKMPPTKIQSILN